MRENVDRRILAALRPVDVVHTLPKGKSHLAPPLTRPVVVQAPGLKWVHNSSGDVVLFDLPSLRKYTHSFTPQPDDPPVKSQSLEIQVRESSGRYLPRLAILELPRKADSNLASQADSIFQPVQLALYPSPSSPTELSWSVIRGSVHDATSGERLPWALIVVRAVADNAVLGRGMADQRGEFLVPVPGIQVNMPATGTGPALTNEVEIRLRVFFDTARVKKITEADLQPGTEDPNKDYLPDPDKLEGLASRAAQIKQSGNTPPTLTGKLVAGRTLSADLLIN